jgi:hypothetical protein
MFSSKDIGNNIPVTVTGLTIIGANAGNYNLSQPAGITANITGNQPKPSDQGITVQDMDQLYRNPFLSLGGVGGVGGMMIMTPGGGVVIVAAPAAAVPVAALRALPADTGAVSPMAAPIIAPPAITIAPSQDIFNGVNCTVVMAQIASPEILGEGVAWVKSQAPAEFMGIGIVSYVSVMTPTEFAGINLEVVCPPRSNFNGIGGSAYFEPIIGAYVFNFAEFNIQAPERATFTGVKAEITGLKITGYNTFRGVRCNIYM